MDTPDCSIIYLDRRAREARAFTKVQPLAHSPNVGSSAISAPDPTLSLAGEVDQNVACLLSTVARVSVYTSGLLCSSSIKSLSSSPFPIAYTLLLVEMPYEADLGGEELGSSTSTGDLYGMHFLSHIIPELQSRQLSGRVFPIALVSQQAPAAWIDVLRNVGASEVLRGPLSRPISATLLKSLIQHAHSVNQTQRERRFTSMTQSMIAELMTDLCNASRLDDAIGQNDLVIEPSRREAIATAFGSWTFSAHSFNEDELLYGVLLLLQHALKDPELEKWRMTEDELIRFLVATRKGYNASVIYHNFRHACDVVQAVFHFLVAIGALPPLIADRSPTYRPSALATLIKPVHALTLIIAAIGHDVGHPGVNNVFLVRVKATVARLYNDHSVLESYHCAALSQILQRFWPAAASDLVMRKLMISSILATDMTLHSQYTTQLDTLQKKFAKNGHTFVEESEQIMEKDRELICCLIIKCADICNVARTFEVAKDWADLVTNEFAHQGELEKDADIPSCLYGGPPTPGDVADLANRQLGFMNIFAQDLFSRVTDILPGMQFTVDTIDANKSAWQHILAQEEQRRERGHKSAEDTESTEQLKPEVLVSEQAERSQSGSTGVVRPGQPQQVPDQGVDNEIPSPQVQAVRPAPPRDALTKESSLRGQSSTRTGAEAAPSRKPCDVRERDLRDGRRQSATLSTATVDSQEGTARSSSGGYRIPGAITAPRSSYSTPNIITSLRLDGSQDADPSESTPSTCTTQTVQVPQADTQAPRDDPSRDESLMLLSECRTRAVGHGARAPR